MFTTGLVLQKLQVLVLTLLFGWDLKTMKEQHVQLMNVHKF